MILDIIMWLVVGIQFFNCFILLAANASKTIADKFNFKYPFVNLLFNLAILYAMIY